MVTETGRKISVCDGIPQADTGRNVIVVVDGQS